MASTRRYGFAFRKLADYSKGRRVGRDGNPLEPWPLLGVTAAARMPKHGVIAESAILSAYKEGWVELEGEEQVMRPAGPHHAPWAGKAGTPGLNHFFLHAKQITFKLVEGDFVYDVAENPDKEHVNVKPQGADETGGGEVSHVYLLDLAEVREAEGLEAREIPEGVEAVEA